MKIKVIPTFLPSSVDNFSPPHSVSYRMCQWLSFKLQKLSRIFCHQCCQMFMMLGSREFEGYVVKLHGIWSCSIKDMQNFLSNYSFDRRVKNSDDESCHWNNTAKVKVTEKHWMFKYHKDEMDWMLMHSCQNSTISATYNFVSVHELLFAMIKEHLFSSSHGGKQCLYT